MEKQARFPYQFFVVTFVWSWLIWLPLVLASAGILPLGKDLLSALSTPATIVAVSAQPPEPSTVSKHSMVKMLWD
jgi:hypothetical protein